MPRIQLNFPEAAVFFKTTIPVMVNHLNYGNHVGQDGFISILHEARMRFFKSHDMAERPVHGNIGFFIVDVAVTSKLELLYGDELTIELAIDDLNKKACDMHYRVTNSASNKLIALAKTRLCFYDFTQNKIADIPVKFLNAICK